jgi:hypothetical protein
MRTVGWMVVCMIAVVCAGCGGFGSSTTQEGSTPGSTPGSAFVLTLTVNPKCVQGKGPNGTGTVSISPSPLEGSPRCEAAGDNVVTCKAKFVKGATVSMTAAPLGIASAFESFAGVTGCGNNPLCRVRMDGDKQVTASFCNK